MIARRLLRLLREGKAPLLFRGVFELALARIAHARLSPRDISQLNARRWISPATEPVARPHKLKFIIWGVRASARLVPWRSDCLVQALAAQRWGSCSGIRTEISIQVGRSGTHDFLAHAVLLHQGRCVLGETEVPLETIYTPPSR